MTRQVQPTSGALRAANRAGVVRVLRHAGWATRAELVERTGLSRATVSSVLGELDGRGLIAERTLPASGARGRPAAQVALDTSAGVAIAVDIGVRHVAVAIGDLSHSVLAEQWTAMPHGHAAEHGTQIVLRSITEALARADVEPDVLVGAAISIAAPVADRSGRFAVPGVLPGWADSTLAECVARRWDIPVVTENDANLGALAEAMSRPDAADGDLLFVKIASRVGLGVVRGNRIVRGRNGFAGEFGHMTARSDGERCWCGRRGCLELYAGGDGMLRRLAGVRPEIAPGGIGSIADMVACLSASSQVRTVVADGVTALARTLADLAVVLDPARIVLGGELTALGETLVGPVRDELSRVPFGAPVELCVSPLGDRASLVGALNFVLTESGRFADRAQGGTAHSHRRAEPGARTVPQYPVTQRGVLT